MNEAGDLVSGLNLAFSCIPSYCVTYEVRTLSLQTVNGILIAYWAKDELDKEDPNS